MYFPDQDSKNGAMEEEEKQTENGKKEEERGREQEGEREADKADSDTGTDSTCISVAQERKCGTLFVTDFFFC